MSNEQQSPQGTGTIVITTNEPAPSSSNNEQVIEIGDRSVERPRVQWTTETVDNEHMGKKSSKCCCIYKKPKKWDESSSEEDSDCETGHCRGHVEKKHKPHHDDEPGPAGCA